MRGRGVRPSRDTLDMRGAGPQREDVGLRSGRQMGATPALYS